MLPLPNVRHPLQPPMHVDRRHLLRVPSLLIHLQAAQEEGML
jgi:hypothetical protein